MGVQIIEDGGVTGLQDRSQGVGAISAEAQTIRNSFEDVPGDQSRGVQGGGDGGSLVMPVGHDDPGPLDARSTTIAADYRRRDGRFVEENQPI